MARTKLVLHYDIVSPFTYMAWEILKRYETLWELDIELYPIYLGGIMVAAENTPPAQNVKRGAYMNMDVARTAKYFDLTMIPPAVFPVQTMHTMRLLRVIAEDRPDLLRHATDLFWTVQFKGGPGDIADLKTFPTILADLKLSESELRSLVEKSVSAANKDRLKSEATQLVRDEGAFGMPWITVTPSGGPTSHFFGSDRFEVLAHTIGKRWEGPHPGRAGSKL